MIPTTRSRRLAAVAPLALLLAALGATSCGQDSRLSTGATDANPPGERTAAGESPAAGEPARARPPLTAAERRAVERRREVAAAVPLPEPATAAALTGYVEERARRLAAIDWAPYPPEPDATGEPAGPSDGAGPGATVAGGAATGVETDPSRPGTVPPELSRLTYEDYRRIEFRPEAALWRDEARFELQLAHPGFLYMEPLRIHVVVDGRIGAIPFDRGRFRYGEGLEWAAEAITPGTTHAGFRVYYPIDDPVDGPDGDRGDRASAGPDPRGTACAGCTREVAVFLGASYFRLVGPGQVHGLSARGLAVDVAEPSGEEFPVFREFWIVRPGPDDATLTFFALLDSPSVTGAYRFELEPAGRTTLRVDARLFARRDVRRPGVAPLTSMFLYGPNRRGEFDDFRPEVHDSDGLLMHTGAGEWIWRPLGNRRLLRVTWLGDRAPAGGPGAGPRGFGLVQRQRRFESYLDLEARYHRRPSLWVTPVEGDWGDGGVELVEIPTTSEFNDNIVAYWRPDRPFRAGEERHYRYRLATFDGRLEEQGLLQVVRTGIGRAALPGQSDATRRSRRRFIVDFGLPSAPARAAGRHAGEAVPPGAGTIGRGPGAAAGGDGDGGRLPGDPPVEAVVETTSGTVSSVVVQPLPDGGGWRAAFDLEPRGNEPADMRLFLEAGGRRLSETWSHVWYPEDVE